MPFSDEAKPLGNIIAGWWPVIVVAVGTIYGYGQLNARFEIVRDRIAVLESMATGNGALAVQLASLTERLASLEREVGRVTAVLERRSQDGAIYPGAPRPN